MKPGTVLKNGAMVLLSKESTYLNVEVVLALYEGQYVTWNYYQIDGVCKGGGYYGSDLYQALQAYNNKT